MRFFQLLTSEEKQGLETSLLKTKDLPEWRRLFVILNYDEGQSIEDLAQLTRLSKWTVEQYLKDYSAHNKTKNDPRGGSTSKLTENETKELEQHLSSITYLKVSCIIAHVKRAFNKKYSRTGMTDWLIKHGFTFKKPEKIPGKLDPNKQARFIEEYEKLKALLGPDVELRFLDAIHPEYQSQAMCGWIKKGECKTLQTTGKQKRLHFLGALNLKDMQITVSEYETIDADALISFFRHIELTSDKKEIHIILDNAAAHKSHKLMDYLKKSRIRLHYLPPYSPNLNPIERLWKVFREMTLYNRYFDTCAEFFETVRGFFRDKVHRIREVLTQRINDNFQIIKLNPIKLG